MRGRRATSSWPRVSGTRYESLELSEHFITGPVEIIIAFENGDLLVVSGGERDVCLIYKSGRQHLTAHIKMAQICRP
jgi:hypothetical protein